MAAMPRLTVRHGEGQVDDVVLGASAIVVGRDASCDVAIDSGYVSRRHARIERTLLGYTVADMGSSNGTFVNHVRIETPTLLARGDEIELGAATLLFMDDDAILAEQTIPLKRTLPVTVDPGARRVYVRGVLLEADLSVQEFALLSLLCQRYGRVVTREEIGDALWGPGAYDYGMLHTLMRRTKNKLGQPLRDAIVAIPRVGYKIELA